MMIHIRSSQSVFTRCYHSLVARQGLALLLVVTANVTFVQAEEVLLRSTPHAVSVAGQKIVSWPSDPWMTAEQEAEIRQRLKRPAVRLVGPIALADYVRNLSRAVAIEIDERSLEENGLMLDTPLFPPAYSEPSTGAQLLKAIKPIDLTIRLQAGILTVLTQEAAEEALVTRVYDVTPLTPANATAVTRRNAIEYLIEVLTVTVAPDEWEFLGGLSTIQWYPTESRILLIVSSTTVTHWKLQRLLDVLNRSEDHSRGHPLPNLSRQSLSQSSPHRIGSDHSVAAARLPKNTFKLPRFTQAIADVQTAGKR